MSHVSSSPSQNTRPARIQQLFRGSFKGMDVTRNLFALKQGPRSLEQHIREFLFFANYSDLPDITLIEIFCDGINQPLRSEFRREGTRASLAQFWIMPADCWIIVHSGSRGGTRHRTQLCEHSHARARSPNGGQQQQPRSVIVANLKASQFTYRWC